MCVLHVCRVSEMSFVLKSVATLISSLKRSAKEVDRHGYIAAHAKQLVR